MLRGRADQLLTSSLFSLSSTLDATTRSLMKEYERRMAQGDLSEEARQDLEFQVGERIPPSGETPLERSAQELLEALFAATGSLDVEKPVLKSLLTTAEKVSRALSSTEGP
jgi:hypothetical protein